MLEHCYEVSYQRYEEDDLGRAGGWARQQPVMLPDQAAVARFADSGGVNILNIRPVTIERHRLLTKDEFRAFLAEGRRQVAELRHEEQVLRARRERDEAEQRLKELEHG